MRNVRFASAWFAGTTIRPGGNLRTLAHTHGALYEGSRYYAHYTAKMKCIGSGMLAKFDPRPSEPERFNIPRSLGTEGL
jgi:hypothetical protein